MLEYWHWRLYQAAELLRGNMAALKETVYGATVGVHTHCWLCWLADWHWRGDPVLQYKWPRQTVRLLPVLLAQPWCWLARVVMKTMAVAGCVEASMYC